MWMPSVLLCCILSKVIITLIHTNTVPYIFSFLQMDIFVLNYYCYYLYSSYVSLLITVLFGFVILMPLPLTVELFEMWLTWNKKGPKKNSQPPRQVVYFLIILTTSTAWFNMEMHLLIKLGISDCNKDIVNEWSLLFQLYLQEVKDSNLKFFTLQF